MRVRRATAADAEVLAQLRHEFRAARATPVESEHEFIARCGEWMSERLRDESHWRAWIVERGASPAGNVWLQLVDKLPNPGPEPEVHGYLTNFFVRPEHRNAGAGSALISALLEECAALGVDAVFLWPTERSRPLYLRHGFRPAGDMLARRRGDESRAW